MELSPIMDVTSKRWLINAPHLNIYIFVEAMLRQQAATYVGIRSLLKFADNSKIHTWKIRWFICYYCLLLLAYALFALSCQHVRGFICVFTYDDDDEIAYVTVRWKTRASFVYRTKTWDNNAISRISFTIYCDFNVWSDSVL